MSRNKFGLSALVTVFMFSVGQLQAGELPVSASSEDQFSANEVVYKLLAVSTDRLVLERCLVNSEGEGSETAICAQVGNPAGYDPALIKFSPARMKAGAIAMGTAEVLVVGGVAIGGGYIVAVGLSFAEMGAAMITGLLGGSATLTSMPFVVGALTGLGAGTAGTFVVVAVDALNPVYRWNKANLGAELNRQIEYLGEDLEVGEELNIQVFASQDKKQRELYEKMLLALLSRAEY